MRTITLFVLFGLPLLAENITCMLIVAGAFLLVRAVFKPHKSPKNI